MYLLYLSLVYRFEQHHAIRKVPQTKKGLEFLAPQHRLTLIVREWRTFLYPVNRK